MNNPETMTYAEKLDQEWKRGWEAALRASRFQTVGELKAYTIPNIGSGHTIYNYAQLVREVAAREIKELKPSDVGFSKYDDIHS